MENLEEDKIVSKKKNRGKVVLVVGVAMAAVFGTVLATDDNLNKDDLTNAQAKIDPKSYFDSYTEDTENYGGSGNLSSVSRSNSFNKDSGYTSRSGGTAPSGSSQTPGGPTKPYFPSPGQDNYYIDYGTIGFIKAYEDNLSTFALDVDTGSFNIGYELAKQGLSVDSTSVRPEEWVNTFNYGDENVSDQMLQVSVETGNSYKDDTKLVRVNVAGQEVETIKENLNITMVIDTSGSMDIQDRLGLVKASVALLAKNLNAEDTLSLVNFDDESQVLMPATKIGNLDDILDGIDRIQPGGGTNLEAGVQKGYEIANQNFDENDNNVVLLASDGVANIGNVTAEAIEDNGKKGIHLVTVGYGMGNYNDGLMEQLADSGDGFYSYLNSYEDTEKFFTEEIEKISTPIALDAKTQVTFDPEIVDEYRLIGYENREIADEDFNNENVDAGEFGSGHNATALYEVKLNHGITSNTIGEAIVRWKDVNTLETQEASSDIILSEENSDKIAFTSLVADTAEYFKLAHNVYYEPVAPIAPVQPYTHSHPEVYDEDKPYFGESITTATKEDLLERAGQLVETFPEVEKIIVILNSENNIHPYQEYDYSK